MHNFSDAVLDIISQFTGGRGGVENLVLFEIAGVTWAILRFATWSKYRHQPDEREALLLVGFAVALARELFMFTMGIVTHFGLADRLAVHVIFPPAEHVLRDISLIIIAAAYMRYLLDDAGVGRLLLTAGICATVVCYFVTFQYWARYITANPGSDFGHTRCDWLFHINGVLWIGLSVIYLWRRTTGWMRKPKVPSVLPSRRPHWRRR